jgi:RNase P subunit RPR2
MNSKDNNIFEKKQFFLDSVAKFCDKCGTPYVLEDVNIIQNTGVSVIIHFSCHSCKSKNIATFVSPLGISNRVPVNTDLTIKEIQKFANKNEVSLEDILEIYICLKENSKISV